MEQGNYINRKTFLRLATFGAVASFVALWNTLAGRQEQLSDKPVVTRVKAMKLGSGIYWYDKFIVVKSAGAVKVFSNRCTHAGCRINREVDGQLVCPCHGSRFDAATGKVLQGPAIAPLPALQYTSDALTGEIIIKI